jgi:hypothetical protein
LARIMDVPESFQPTASRREIRVPSDSQYSWEKSTEE